MRLHCDTVIGRRRLRAAACLTMLSLALLQLSLASHQFDHPAGDLAEFCEICVKLERLDDATTWTAPQDVNAVEEPVFETIRPAVAVETSPVRPYRSRAPPKI